MLRVLLLSLPLFVCTPAYAVYKCESEGKVTYGDAPCREGQQSDVETPGIPQADDSASRIAREKKMLKQLEKERHKREAVEDRERKISARAGAARQKKCDKLARRQKRAFEDVAASVGKANEKAKLKARRITEDYEAACGRWPERELSLAR